MAWSYYVYILDLCIISYKNLILSVCHQGIDIAPQETQKNWFTLYTFPWSKVIPLGWCSLLPPSFDASNGGPWNGSELVRTIIIIIIIIIYDIVYIYIYMHVYIYTYICIYNNDKPVVYGIILWILGLSATYSGWSSKLPWNPATLTGHNKVMSIYIGR